MIYREVYDASLANAISNDPDILPFVSRTGEPVDWTPALSSCVVLTNGEDAVAVLEQAAPRYWQCMTLFGKTCRGKKAIEAGREIREFMAPHADVIFGSIPDKFRAATWFYRQLGGKQVEVVEANGDMYTAQDGETLYRVELNA